MEHPEPAWWKRSQAPSSFYWGPLEAIQSSPACYAANFDQCVYHDCGPETIGKAPARLPGFRMPMLAANLLSAGSNFRCNHPGGSHLSLKGKDELGRFRTSRKETYPTNMCKHIAAAIAYTIQSQFASPTECDANAEDTDASLAEDLWTFYCKETVSYTHLTLPTILLV
eukprot:8775604-Pyramimonas_sp.AAC.1